MINRYAAGNKVYRGGSSAPNRGMTLDPSGFAARSMRQQASKKRSGLAQAAVRRLNNKIDHLDPGLRRKKLRERRLDVRRGIVKRSPGADKKQLHRINRTDNKLERQIRSQGGNPNPPGKKPGQDSGGGGRKKNGPPVKGLEQAPKPPVVRVTPNGQLNLPWNLDNNLQAIEAYNQQQQGLQGLQEQQQQYETDYTRTMRDFDIQQGRDDDSLLNNFASRGMAFSSAYGNAFEDQQRLQNNYQTDLNTDRTQFLANIAQRRLGVNNNFYDVLRSLAMENAMDASKRAGDLGYGRSQRNAHGDKMPNRPKKKPGNKKNPPKKHPGHKKRPRNNKRDNDRPRHAAFKRNR